MTAVDTNVLLRVIIRDNEAQAARAHAVLKKQERVFVAKTVLLEVEWVLRGGYGYTRPQILAVMRELLDTPNIEVEDEAAVSRALFWHERGLDFADSLHVASAGQARSFASFDEKLQRKARNLGINVVQP